MKPTQRSASSPWPASSQPADVEPQRVMRGRRRLEAPQRALRGLREQPRKIERAAGFGPGAGKPRAAERLHAHHRADDVAVDIDVAGFDPLDNARDRFVDPRMEAEGEAVAGGVDRHRSGGRARRAGSAAHAERDRTPRARHRRSCRSSISVGATNVPCAASSGNGACVTRWPRARIASTWSWMASRASVGDHRPDVDGELSRCRRFPARAIAPFSIVSDAVGDIVLQAQDAQRRAALPGRIEGRGDDVADDLFGERGGIDHHRVEAAGLGDQRQRRARRVSRPASSRWISRATGGRASEHDALHARIGDERRADFARAGQEREARRAERRLHAAAARLRPRSAASPPPAWRRRRCRRRARRRSGR